MTKGQTNAQMETDISGKQDRLTAGSNITISGSTISATDTRYTAGEGISISGTTISATSSGGGAPTYAHTSMSGSITTLYNAVKGLSVGDVVVVSGYGAVNKTYYDAMGGSFCGVVTAVDSTTVYLNAAGTVYYCDSSSTDYAGPYPIGCAGTDYSISISYSEIWAGTIQGTNVQVGKIFSKGMYGYVTTLHFS